MNTSDRLDNSAICKRAKCDNEPFPEGLSKVVIQEIPSGLYLSQEDFWTPDIEDARPLDSCSAALEEATHLKLNSVQLFVNRVPKEWAICQSGTGVISQLTQGVRRWCR